MIVLQVADGPSFEKALLRARREDVEIVVRGRMTGRYRADLPENRTLLIRGEEAIFDGTVIRKDWRNDGNGRWSRPAQNPADRLQQMSSRVSDGRLRVTLDRRWNPQTYGLQVVPGGAPLLDLRGGKRVELRDLSLMQAPLGGNLLRISGTRAATLQSVYGSAGRGGGIVLNQIGTATLRQVQTDGTGGTGVFVDRTGRLDWKGGSLRGHAGPAVHVSGGRGHRISGIRVVDTKGVGFRLAADAVLDNCDARLCAGGGAVVEGPVRVDFRNSHLDYNPGIQLLVRGPGQVSFRKGFLRTPPTGPADRAAAYGTDRRGRLTLANVIVVDRRGRYVAGGLRSSSRETRFCGPRPVRLGPGDIHLPDRT